MIQAEDGGGVPHSISEVRRRQVERHGQPCSDASGEDLERVVKLLNRDPKCVVYLFFVVDAVATAAIGTAAIGSMEERPRVGVVELSALARFLRARRRWS